MDELMMARSNQENILMWHKLFTKAGHFYFRKKLLKIKEEILQAFMNFKAIIPDI